MFDPITCANYWQHILDLKEGELSDTQYKTLTATIAHLGDYEKLRLEVKGEPKLPPIDTPVHPG